MNPIEIKIQFKRKVVRFVIANIAMLVILGVALQMAKLGGYYQQAFVPVVIVFLIWLFNADKLYRCPQCQAVPRGKEGLISIPKRCQACGVELR